MTASTESHSEVTVERFYTPVEIAALLGLNKKTITNWLKDPKHPLKGTKLGNNTWRIPESNYKRYLETLYGNQSASVPRQNGLGGPGDDRP